MKKLLFIIIVMGLFSVLVSSCYKDTSTEGDLDFPSATVSGVEASYTAYTHRDILHINPTVANETQYDFYWTVYSTNFTQGTGLVPKADTLAKTKELSYEVLLDPGQYILILNIKDKKTSVTDMKTINLTVSTLNMGGWYLLKDDGQKTDFDFIYSGGRINNWIAYYNDGKSIEGKALKAVFAPSFKLSPASTNLFNVFAVISDKDAAIYRIDNGKLVMGFDNMFFTKPDVKKPQNILQPMSVTGLCLVNDSKVYWMNKGALFANSNVTNYKISPVAAVGAAPILFDENSKSIVVNDNGNNVALGTSGAVLKNMNAELVWIGGYAGVRSIALALFRQNDGSGLLVRMNAATGYLLYNTSPLIQVSKTVPQAHGLMSADVIGGNYDSDYIYYAKGNKIYLTDLASLQEALQVTLPAGETVTCIQHIKYPQPASGVATTTDYLAIASYANGHYKVWLHKISSTGTISALPQPTFEGDGRISCINYVEQGNGSRVF